jgi:hypothetical protein
VNSQKQRKKELDTLQLQHPRDDDGEWKSERKTGNRVRAAAARTPAHCRGSTLSIIHYLIYNINPLFGLTTINTEGVSSLAAVDMIPSFRFISKFKSTTGVVPHFSGPRFFSKKVEGDHQR